MNVSGIRPVVSVCMATFNGEKYILEQISSVLSQLSSSDEVIISDDGSIDETLSILHSVNDPRIKLYISDESGVVSNFENAINKAKGDVIVLCDQDDVWLPGRIEQAIKGAVNYDLVVVGYQTVDANLKPIKTYFSNRASNSFIKTLIKNGYLGCSMSIRRNVLASVLPFPKKIAMHDWWIALVCMYKYKVVIYEEEFFLYRRHGANASVTGEKSKYSLIKKINFRVFLLFNLVLRFIIKFRNN